MIFVENNQLTEEQVAIVVALDDLPTTPDGYAIAKTGPDSFENKQAGGLGSSFETVSANLSAYDNVIGYNGNGDVDTITYDLGGGLEIVKTINYNGNDDVTSIVLSGDTPSGINLTKSFTYTGEDITGMSYS